MKNNHPTCFYREITLKQKKKRKKEKGKGEKSSLIITMRRNV
jgi:hypothetical protein